MSEGVAPAMKPVDIDEDAPDRAPINILIVDDEPGNLAVLETVLDNPGYRLVRARSADEALMALIEEEFALLILDIRLPDMSGFELAQLIKERKKTAAVPIIFVTAYYDKDQHALEGYGTGAVDFLTKPVNAAVLRSKVMVFADLFRGTRAVTRAKEKLLQLNETLERRVIERSEALRQADHKLQAVMGSITDGVLMFDRGWHFTYFNEKGASILGMSPEQLAGGTVWELLPHTRGSKFEEGFRRAVDTRQTVSFEEFYPAPLDLWFQCHCYPSDDGLSVYFHDITDRREVEVRREQLLAAEQAARSEGDRLARAKEEFLASLSHELRTPLAAIVGWANILKKSPGDADTLRRGLDAIARNAHAQAHLVDDLLEMSRIVSGKLRMTIDRVDLNAIAAAAVDTAGPAAETKGVRIGMQLADGAVVESMGDAARLQQVVSNLLTNALKFTPSGGTVTVSTAATGSFVELSVADTGEGIAPEFLSRVFDRFSQADGSAARAHGGLGLGLSIVHTLVELHAGTVEARSAGKGQGATFTVRLPKVDHALATPGDVVQLGDTSDRPVASEAMDLDGGFDLQDVSVLLVDDHDDVLEVERRMLCEAGARVTTAGSAREALHHLGRSTFDVLLSDLGMPDMDGFALIEAIRATPGLDAGALPAAAVTAFVRAEDRQRALRSGYQAVVQKPVGARTLARAVTELRASASASRPVGASPTSTLHALLVEDNADLREQIGWLLEDEGVEVVSCGTAEEAEALFAPSRFSLVVTDVSLPGMSGMDFARRLSAVSPETWIVFATGHSLQEQLDGFGPRARMLQKPFDGEDLHRVLAEVRASGPPTGPGDPVSG